MKHFRKSQSPYFKKRDSFQSPECSTVIEVNPSCQSEESMLQKIIFPNHMNSKNYCESDRFRKQPLQQKCMNSINVNHINAKVSKSYKYLDEYKEPKITKPEYYEYRSKQNEENMSNRYKSCRSSKEKYEWQQTNKSPRQRLNSHSSTNSVRNLMQRTQPKLSTRLESYQSGEVKKNYSTQKYNNYQSYNDENDSETVIDEEKLHQIQQKIRMYRERNRKPVDKQSETHKQTAKKTTFRDTMQSQLNNIKIQFLPSHQNRLKKKQTIIDHISSMEMDNMKLPTYSSKGAQTFTRVPGRLLSHNKTGLRKETQFMENKKYEFTQKESPNPSNTFRTYSSDLNNMIQISSIQNLPSSQRVKQPTRITKNVYMQPTQKTENDEVYQPKYRERYATEIDLNEKGLELMLAQEKAKKYVPLKMENDHKGQVYGDDEELERLNNLQKKFNEHFNSRK